MLEAIGRNTRLLFLIAHQMKQVLRAIEGIPSRLDVDIIRLDDALGETWGLPLQACGSWDVSRQGSCVCGVCIDQSKSFCHLLQHVVFAGRPGHSRVTTGQFAITLATSGAMMNRRNWQDFIKRDVHIQQAMVVSRENTSMTSEANVCPFPGCSGVVQRGHGSKNW